MKIFKGIGLVLAGLVLVILVIQKQEADRDLERIKHKIEFCADYPNICANGN